MSASAFARMSTEANSTGASGTFRKTTRVIFVASFNSNLRDLFVYALLILVLVIKPSGLMGKFVEDKA